MANLKKWEPEDSSLWEKEGKTIANRILWISIPSLVCGSMSNISFFFLRKQ